MANLKNLSILPVNKSVVFYSPLEGSDVLVRTGTVGDGSCLYHSILHAYSKEYVLKNHSERMKMVNRLRKSMACKITQEEWELIDNGLVSKISFQENVNRILSEFYKFIIKGGRGSTKDVRFVIRSVIEDEKRDIEIYKILVELLPLSNEFEKNILPYAYQKSEKQTIKKTQNIIIELSVKHLKEIFFKLSEEVEEERINFYIQKLENLLKKV